MFFYGGPARSRGVLGHVRVVSGAIFYFFNSPYRYFEYLIFCRVCRHRLVLKLTLAKDEDFAFGKGHSIIF